MRLAQPSLALSSSHLIRLGFVAAVALVACEKNTSITNAPPSGTSGNSGTAGAGGSSTGGAGGDAGGTSGAGGAKAGAGGAEGGTSGAGGTEGGSGGTSSAGGAGGNDAGAGGSAGSTAGSSGSGNGGSTAGNVCLPEGAAEGSVRCVEQNGVGKLESCQSGNWSTPSPCEGNAGCQDASGCKPLAGPTMVREPAKGYWIDSTEVTNAQYKKFLDSKPDIKTLPTSSSSCLGQQTPNIGGNHSFYPGVLTKIGTPCVSSSSLCDFTYDDAYMNANPSKPVVCVDWCDASAYCEWAGKRLCGDINGGPLDSTLYKDSSASQWYRACAGPSGSVYPYGNSYEPTTCNTQGTSLLDVGQKANCEGSLPGLHDMSGNVWEWEEACTTYQPLSASPDKCLQRGGAYETGAPATYGRCDSSGDPICYMDQRKYLGFRCCSVK